MTVGVPLEWFLYPCACFLVYLPCLNGPPIFDDHVVIAELGGFQWTKAYFRRDNYRILTLLTLGLQKLWPGTIRSIHVGNMLIHTVNGFVVKAIGSRLGMDDGLALLAGLLFVVHPFAVNSVGYITGRASILSSTFGLLAVLAVVSGWGLLAIPLIGLAFLAKEDGAGFVPLVVILSLYIR